MKPDPKAYPGNLGGLDAIPLGLILTVLAIAAVAVWLLV